MEKKLLFLNRRFKTKLKIMKKQMGERRVLGKIEDVNYDGQ